MVTPHVLQNKESTPQEVQSVAFQFPILLNGISFLSLKIAIKLVMLQFQKKEIANLLKFNY